MLGAYQWYARRAAIHPKSKTGRKFSAFGDGSIMCFPPAALFGERAIRVGRDTMIGPYVSLSAGMAPTQELLSDRIIEIGDRVLIGRNSSIVGHFHIVIEDDVFFGPNVYVTDQNHAFDDLGLTALCAIIHPDNTASSAVAEKLGFLRTGCITRLGFNLDHYTLWRDSLINGDDRETTATN